MWSAGTSRIHQPTASSAVVRRMQDSFQSAPHIEAHRPATTEMNGCIAPLCQSCLRLLRRVNDTISHPAQGLDPSPKRKADHVRSLCYAQSSFGEMAAAAAAGCRVCKMAQAQVRAGRFTRLTWPDDDDDDDDGPWPGDDLMAGEGDAGGEQRMGTGFLLSRPFEEPGGLVCVRFYVDFRDESRALFATLDEVLWLSPPVRAPAGAGPWSPRLSLRHCLTLLRSSRACRGS